MVLMGTMEPMHGILAILAVGMCAISGQLVLACQYGWRLLRYLEMPIEAWVVEYAGAAAQSDGVQQPRRNREPTAQVSLAGNGHEQNDMIAAGDWTWERGSNPTAGGDHHE
jgi:hypothetical protein